MLKKTILSDDVVRAIGRMVVNFQSFELDVAMFIWIMSDPDGNAAPVKTAGKRFSELCDLMSALFHDQVKAPLFVKTFDDIISRARTVNKDRNRIVHSWWFT